VVSKRADEFAAELAERYRSDPFYRAQVDAAEARRREAAEERERRIAPFREDLKRQGVSEIYDRSTGKRIGDPRIFETALDHLSREGYDDETRGSIARSFETRDAATYWEQIVALYLAAIGPSERDGLAASLATCARSTHVEAMKTFVGTPRLGSSRIFFLRPINRLDRAEGRAFVLDLIDDPELGIEAEAIRRRLSRNA
jgi:hypothetical protein